MVTVMDCICSSQGVALSEDTTSLFLLQCFIDGVDVGLGQLSSVFPDSFLFSIAQPGLECVCIRVTHLEFSLLSGA